MLRLNKIMLFAIYFLHRSDLKWFISPRNAKEKFPLDEISMVMVNLNTISSTSDKFEPFSWYSCSELVLSYDNPFFIKRPSLGVRKITEI